MRTANKKPTPAFVIRLVGEGIRPWDVPMRKLTSILNAIQRLIEHAEPDTGESEETAKESESKPTSPIQLLDVVSRSAAYPVAAFDGIGALRILSETGKNLQSPSCAEWDSPTISAIEDISAAAKALGCIVEIGREAKNGDVIASIRPESYAQIAASAFIKSRSSVYGYLARVGGAGEPHCGLRIASQPEKMVICHLASSDLAKGLGPHMYSTVRVSGEVTWYRKGRRVKTVYVEHFDAVKGGSIRDALENIWRAGGKAWDEIENPEAVMKGAEE